MTEDDTIEKETNNDKEIKPQYEKRKSHKKQKEDMSNEAEESFPKTEEHVGTTVKSLSVSELSEEDLEAIANSKVPDGNEHLNDLLDEESLKTEMQNLVVHEIVKDPDNDINKIIDELPPDRKEKIENRAKELIANEKKKVKTRNDADFDKILWRKLGRKIKPTKPHK